MYRIQVACKDIQGIEKKSVQLQKKRNATFVKVKLLKL